MAKRHTDPWHHYFEPEFASGKGVDTRSKPHTTPTGVLTNESERMLFRRLNYRRYRASRAPNNKRTVKAADTGQRVIIEYNINAIYRAAMKYARIEDADRGEIVADCFFALNACIPRFDYRRGWKFSTYFWRSMIRRAGRGRRDKRSIYAIPFSQMGSDGMPDWAGDYDHAPDLKELRTKLLAMVETLEERPCSILTQLHPMDGTSRTLEMVGTLHSLSKERIRQIKNTATAEIRSAFSRP